MSNDENRLYVGNLAEDITATALRQRFEKIGPVADVELAMDRGSGRFRGFAFVKMVTREGFQVALAQMNGIQFEDRVLRVVEAGTEREEGGGRGRGKKEAPQVKITSQFRERTCMALELDCNGTKLGFKMYPTADETGKESWRIEASSSARQPDPMVTGSAATRRQAFEIVEREWGQSNLNWRAIEECLANVRAI